MEGNKAGVIFVVIVLLAVAASFTLALNPPQVKKYTPATAVPKGASNVTYENITIYACALGWDYGHGPINPTISIANNTLVCFTVIEEGTQPHTLTFNPGSKESSYQYTALDSAQISTVTGTISKAAIFFDQIGIFTYWCIIHPTTMVGNIYVNATVNKTGPTAHYSNYQNESFSLSNGGFLSGGHLNPTIYLPVSTLLNVSVTDSSATAYSFAVSSGSAVNTANAVDAISSTNTSANASIPFNSTGIYTYFNGQNTSNFGHIYVYASQINVSIYADKNGFNYSLSSGRNPTINVSAGMLVVFTLINHDNLSHDLVIAYGPNEVSNYTYIAGVNSSQNESIGTYLFLTAGNYTYWDTFHPSTAVGTIQVANSSSSAAIFTAMQPASPAIGEITPIQTSAERSS